MSWQQDIMDQLNAVGSISVRFDVEQELTATEKARARNNIDVLQTSTQQISGDDYKIVVQ